MLISFHCIDHDNVADLRVEFLAQHLEWVSQNKTKIKVAGPLLDKNNYQYGSMYIVEASSIEQAEQLLAQDPYHNANIWRSITTNEFKDYAGTWVGGKNWPGA